MDINDRISCYPTMFIWVRIKSCQPDLCFSEQTDVAGGTTTLQLGTDVVDLDSGDFTDVTSSDVEDDINLRGRVLIVLSQACDNLILTPPLRFSDGFSARTHMASLTPHSNHRVSLLIILTSSKSVLCPLAFKWSKTAESLMTSHPGNHRSQGLQHQYPAEGWWFHPQRWFAPKNASLVDKI